MDTTPKIHNTLNIDSTSEIDTQSKFDTAPKIETTARIETASEIGAASKIDTATKVDTWPSTLSASRKAFLEKWVNATENLDNISKRQQLLRLIKHNLNIDETPDAIPSSHFIKNTASMHNTSDPTAPSNSTRTITTKDPMRSYDYSLLNPCISQMLFNLGCVAISVSLRTIQMYASGESWDNNLVDLNKRSIMSILVRIGGFVAELFVFIAWRPKAVKAAKVEL